ncbi:MAG: type II toxin-antitoxin system VapC family toxin [Halobacteriaceae archaeon]
MAYLIDTDWAVDYLKGVDEKVSFLQSHDQLHIATISIGELVEGIEDSGRKEEREDALEDFIAGVTVLAFTREMAASFGNIRNKLRKQGELVGDIDIMIGATARVHDLNLLTDNTAHFELMPSVTVYGD